MAKIHIVHIAGVVFGETAYYRLLSLLKKTAVGRDCQRQQSVVMQRRKIYENKRRTTLDPYVAVHGRRLPTKAKGVPLPCVGFVQEPLAHPHHQGFGARGYAG